MSIFHCSPLTGKTYEYLTYFETKEYLGLNNKDWSLHHRKLPWVTIKNERYCGLVELNDIKRKISPRYYYLKAEMIRETRLYYELFDKRVKDLNIPTFKHPFNTRKLYRTSDIPIIKRGYNDN